MSSRGFTPPDDPAGPPAPEAEGEPDTVTDEMAADDAPEPEVDV